MRYRGSSPETVEVTVSRLGEIADAIGKEYNVDTEDILIGLRQSNKQLDDLAEKYVA
jgi:hypothetical protein